MSVRLYAVLRVRPRARPLLPAGLHGERIRLVKCAGFSLAVADTLAALAPTPDHLLKFDRIVTELAGISDAILPARFGMVAGDLAMLKGEIADRTVLLVDALDLVAGRVQMTLRLPAEEPRTPARRHGPSGRGATYLQNRVAASRPPALAKLRKSLADLVRAERIAPAPGRTSVYHLIEAGDVAAYLARLTGVRASGPFPPYAFVPGIDRAIWPWHDEKTQPAGIRPARPGADRRSPRNAH